VEFGSERFNFHRSKEAREEKRRGERREERGEKRREEKRGGMAGMGGPVSQDWDPVVVRKKVPNAATKKDEKAVNEARRSGGPIETIKKCKKFLSLLLKSSHSSSSQALTQLPEL
jgi:hypothetical protein